MKKLVLIVFVAFIAGMTLLESCRKDESTDPPKVGIFYSIVDKKVAFTALTKRIDAWNWDFGDGETSNEKDPVHIYEGGGYYTVILTGTDATGKNVQSEVSIAVAVTPYVLLTGGSAAVNGKTWKLTSNHPAADKLSNADAGLTIADGAPPSLPQGVFTLYLDMGEVYDDEYTFHYDGSYSHDTKADHAAFAGMVNQFMTTGGAGIVNDGGEDFGLCTALYTPEAGAKFTYVEKEDLAVPSVYGDGGLLTYTDVCTLDFTGTEFVGFLDNQRKVIVQEITDNSMRLVMFMAASPTYFPLNTHALVLSFEVVK